MYKNNSNILLTGASGFLGSHILNVFINSSTHVITLGRTNPFKDSKNSDHIHWDMENIPSIPDIKYDKVVHVAGLAHLKKKVTT